MLQRKQAAAPTPPPDAQARHAAPAGTSPAAPAGRASGSTRRSGPFLPPPEPAVGRAARAIVRLLEPKPAPYVPWTSRGRAGQAPAESPARTLTKTLAKPLAKTLAKPLAGTLG